LLGRAPASRAALPPAPNSAMMAARLARAATRGGTVMRRAIVWGVVLLAAAFAAAGARAETIRVGLLLPYSGPFQTLATQMENAIKVYMEQNAGRLGAHKVEIIRRDTTGPAPELAKRLGQELIVQNKVHVITGLIFTPNTLALAPLASETKTPLVVMNA